MFIVFFKSENCGGTLTSRFGYIKSPNWPKAYGESENCEWVIRSPLGHRLELVVHNFTLESDYDADDCKGDWLEIRWATWCITKKLSFFNFLL